MIGWTQSGESSRVNVHSEGKEVGTLTLVFTHPSIPDFQAATLCFYLCLVLGLELTDRTDGTSYFRDLML